MIKSPQPPFNQGGERGRVRGGHSEIEIWSLFGICLPVDREIRIWNLNGFL